MAITSLRITDFRNVSAAELLPCQDGLNIISGDNGSGKTSILEAIHYLGLGRSFRTSTSNRLIKHEKGKFSLFAQLIHDAGRELPVGVEREITGSTRQRIAEKDTASIAELATLLPILIINSYSHNLFEGGPAFRRKYLDWGLFYQIDGFLPCWRQFERVLKQRNAVLRDKRPKRELDVWTEELIKHGLALDAMRRAYLQQLLPLLIEITQELLGFSNLVISYQPGWDERQDFASTLAAFFADEYRYGYTQFGPQRADLDVTMDGIPMKHILSRGQQKLLVCAMITAQGMLLTRGTNRGLIYLIDDLPSELDLHSRKKLIALLAKQQRQVFITAIDSSTINEIDSELLVPTKVFHVEHGIVKEQTAGVILK
jgi:DNA replication and repair protein RecF